MQALIAAIRGRLAQRAYVSEAAVSVGIVTPILNALGWNSADPDQLVPEYTVVGRGRVDFALLGRGGKPVVFIEVKGVGLAIDGDRQLFEYAFHEGVPLCVLTDGREWSFFLPGGVGRYDERRVYRLQLDDRDPEECERVLIKYLAHDRVRDGRAAEAARLDHENALSNRQAVSILPRAWTALLEDEEGLVLDAVADKTEALCGYKPTVAAVRDYLRSLRPNGMATPGEPPTRPVTASAAKSELPKASPPSPPSSLGDRTITYRLFGQDCSAANASLALIEVLRSIVARDPSKLHELADRVRTPRRSHVAQNPADIAPGRPDLGRASEIAPGWYVGLNIANRQKMGIIRAACELYELKLPDDLDIQMPNA